MFNRQSLRYKINIAIFLTRGGEEFLVLLPQQELAQAAMLAENLRATIESTTVPEVKKVTSNFGVTGYMTEDTVESLVKRADCALYRAKELGRNRVEILEPENGI
jgi:diguanylate cyclase (GGDEF)-like protein